MAIKTKKRSGKKSEIKTLVVDFFNNHNKESFNYKQVAVDLGVTGRSDQYLIADILDDLTRDGYLTDTETVTVGPRRLSCGTRAGKIPGF